MTSNTQKGCKHEPTGDWSVTGGKSYARCRLCHEDYPTTLFQGNMHTPPESKVEEDYKVFDCFSEGCGECEVCEYLSFREWAEGCAPAGSNIERSEIIEDYLKRKDTHRTQLLQEIEGEVLNETYDVLPPPDDAKDFMGDWERGVVTGGYSVKERVLTIIRNKQIP